MISKTESTINTFDYEAFAEVAHRYCAWRKEADRCKAEGEPELVTLVAIQSEIEASAELLEAVEAEGEAWEIREWRKVGCP